VRNGELTFGGVDATKFTGEITYVYVPSLLRDLTDCWELLCSYCLVQSHHNGSSFQSYWGIDASLRYGNESGNGLVINLNTTAGVVDTGNTFLCLAAGKLLRDSDSYPMSELRYNIYVRRV
jgi:hypothetical protein